MSLRSLFSRAPNRGLAAWLRRARRMLAEDEPLFELPELVEKPAGARVMVVAPHADDETLGCGGTLFKHHCAGDRITAVFMTDGSKGDVFAGGISGQALIELREQEARAAATVLGIDECVFLRNPDASLECSPHTVAQMRQLLESLRPQVLYAPPPFDTHRDHRQACAITAAALVDSSHAVQVCLYEIWAPVPANCAVVIDLERKIEAVRAYRSQMDERGLYVTAATTLARYRGVTCLPGQDVAVECFLRLDRAAFVAFAKRIA